MAEFTKGTLVKPQESAEKYMFTDTTMELGMVIDTFTNDEGELGLLLAPVVHEFQTAEIMLGVLLGMYREPFIGMVAPGVEAKDMRPATEEEIEEHAEAVKDFIENKAPAKIEVGNKLIIRDEVPSQLPIQADKEYEIKHDDERSYHVVDDAGNKVNSVFNLFKYEVVEGGN